MPSWLSSWCGAWYRAACWAMLSSARTRLSLSPSSSPLPDGLAQLSTPPPAATCPARHSEAPSLYQSPICRLENPRCTNRSNSQAMPMACSLLQNSRDLKQLPSPT
ncbi:hypothetical protein BDZ91DRAFT_725351 [Kalaharituber pfeilii]|nr:hypothetical protein BDZ91DRAFT_725351 [Kalaharituber pfeilii]